MDPAFAAAALRHLARKYGADHATRILAMERIRSRLFDRQLAVIDDPSKNKTALCGRAAGKTTMDAAYLCLEAIRRPNALCLYITLTRKNAKQLLWSELHRINHECGLQMEPNASDLMMTAPNGSRIWLGGADNEAQIEKYRGFPFALVVLDECASFGPHIDALIKDVIEPRLMDLDGTMLMTGTPGPVCSGAFHDATVDPSRGWSWHGWTVLQNPYMPNAAAWLAERRRIGRLTEDDPTYRREWMAEWVPDLNALVYQYDPARNGWGVDEPLPSSPEPWEYGLGVDIGYDPDPAAYVVVAWNRRHPGLYVLEAAKHVGLLPAEQAAEIQRYMRRYPFATIVADAAGLGKGIVAEWRQRYRIPVHPAKDKHLKREHIQMLNSDFRAGNIKIRDGCCLVHELTAVTWEADRKTVSDRHPNDTSDAFEYIAIAAKHFAHTPLPAPLTAGERVQKEADEYERRAIERAEARESGWEL